MVVKFLSNKKGGSTKSIDYLLNKKRVEEKTARVLSGDVQLTRQIINSIDRKQKVTFGVLSFEEPNISEQKKHELMGEFERTLMPGLEEGRYNILWVEHTDKGRLELNFIIPKTDLETHKALQPYFFKQDQKRIELFQDYVNLRDNYSNPKDPSKARIVEGATKKVNIQKDHEQLNKLLHDLVGEGAIKNREQLIELLKKNNIEVNRQGKDYISIKLPNSKRAKRFKKGIYSEEFTSVGAVREIGERARAEIKLYDSRDTSAELRELKAELDRFTQFKLKQNRTRYKKPEHNNAGKYRLGVGAITDEGQKMVDSRASDSVSIRNNYTSYNEGGIEDDRARTAVIRRIRFFRARSGSRARSTTKREGSYTASAGRINKPAETDYRAFKARRERRRQRRLFSVVYRAAQKAAGLLRSTTAEFFRGVGEKISDFVEKNEGRRELIKALEENKAGWEANESYGRGMSL
jgi:hypothetical protein